MDSSLRQTRVRRGDGMPQQKNVSFMGEKKRQNLFQRQFSGQKSEGNESSDGEFATRIAAAVYAITSLEEEGSLNNKRPVEGLQTSLTKTKSKRGNGITKSTDSSRISRWFSGTEANEDKETIGKFSTRKSEAEDSTTKQNVPGKEAVKVPSIKKTPTFTDKYLNDMGSTKFESTKENRTEKSTSATTKPTTLPTSNGKWGVTNPSKMETKADAWKKAEMRKIRERYEKTSSMIQEWENQKKTKAKRRLEQKERELEKRRARVLQEYCDKISRIDKIAGGAKAGAEERKRNEESETREKANEMRSTGKVPHACFCC